MGKRGVPDSDIPEAPKTEVPADKPEGTVRTSKKDGSKRKAKAEKEAAKAQEIFEATMNVIAMGPQLPGVDVAAGVAKAVSDFGEEKVFAALRKRGMPEEFLKPTPAATTQDVAPVTSADDSLPSVPQPVKAADKIVVDNPAQPTGETPSQIADQIDASFKGSDDTKVGQPVELTDEQRASIESQSPEIAAVRPTPEGMVPVQDGRGGAVFVPAGPNRGTGAIPALATGPAEVFSVPTSAPAAPPKPGTFTIRDLLAGRVNLRPATEAPAASPVPTPQAAAAATQAIQQPAREPALTADDMWSLMGSEPFVGPTPLAGMTEYGPPVNTYDPSIEQSSAMPQVQVRATRIPQAIPKPASMESIMEGLGMNKPPENNPAKLQSQQVEGFERTPATVEDGVGSFVVNTPRPSIRQMQQAIEAEAATQPATPKPSVYDRLGMKKPQSYGIYENLPAIGKAAATTTALGAGAYGLLNAFGAFEGGQQQAPAQTEDPVEAARRRLMSPVQER